MAKRSYSYKFLTMGGRRFVQLTPERFERLFKKEQESIIKTAEATGEDLRTWTRETWEQLGETPEIRRSAFRRAFYIAEGGVIEEVNLGIAKAYIEALKMSGRDDLAARLSSLTNNLDEEQLDMLWAELPNIHSIYPERGRSYSKGRLYAMQMTREDSLSDISAIISTYEKELYREQQ